MNVLNDPKTCAMYSGDMRKCVQCQPAADKAKCYRPKAQS